MVILFVEDLMEFLVFVLFLDGNWWLLLLNWLGNWKIFLVVGVGFMFCCVFFWLRNGRLFLNMFMLSLFIDGIFFMIFLLFIFEGFGVVIGGLFFELKVSWLMLGILFNIVLFVIWFSLFLFFVFCDCDEVFWGGEGGSKGSNVFIFLFFFGFGVGLFWGKIFIGLWFFGSGGIMLFYICWLSSFCCLFFLGVVVGGCVGLVGIVGLVFVGNIVEFIWLFVWKLFWLLFVFLLLLLLFLNDGVVFVNFDGCVGLLDKFLVLGENIFWLNKLELFNLSCLIDGMGILLWEWIIGLLEGGGSWIDLLIGKNLFKMFFSFNWLKLGMGGMLNRGFLFVEFELIEGGFIFWVIIFCSDLFLFRNDKFIGNGFCWEFFFLLLCWEGGVELRVLDILLKLVFLNSKLLD